jgi:hypothetical protein
MLQHGSSIFQRNNRFHHYNQFILIHLFRNLTEKGNIYDDFMEDNATAQTTGLSVTVLHEVLTGEFPHLYLCNHLWGTLEDRMHVNNPHSLQETGQYSQQNW